MVYRSVRPRPPRGSTAWGAQQFLRVLDEEEKIAAERERLLATGWRPPSSLTTASSVSGAIDERAYAELIDHDLADRRGLEEEARRRASPWTGTQQHTTPASRLPSAEYPGAIRRAGGGRLGLPVPSPNAGDAGLLQKVEFAATRLPGSPTPKRILDRPQTFESTNPFALLAMGYTMAQAMAIYQAEAFARRREMEAASREARRDMLPVEPPAPPRDFDPEEARRFQQEFGNPPPSIVSTLDDLIETYPIHENDLPTLETFPDLSDEINQVTILEVNRWGRRGSPETQNHIWDVQRDFEKRHQSAIQDRTLVHIGGGFMAGKGGEQKPEEAIPGPGAAMEADGRPGSRFPDLLYFSKRTGRPIAINTVDVDADGNIAQWELDAAEALRRTGADVYLIKKPHQLR